MASALTIDITRFLPSIGLKALMGCFENKLDLLN